MNFDLKAMNADQLRNEVDRLRTECQTLKQNMLWIEKYVAKHIKKTDIEVRLTRFHKEMVETLGFLHECVRAAREQMNQMEKFVKSERAFTAIRTWEKVIDAFRDSEEKK